MISSCVVQARMGSTRFPGKIVAELGGKSVLQFMLDRLRGLPIEHLIVATTNLPIDDPVVEIASAAGFKVVRGSETDVLSRFIHALDAYQADAIVRLTADCPLADPSLINAAIALLADSGADYASNTLVRTFPDGLDVEVLRAEALRQAASEATDPIEREHVTPFIYRRPERYRLVALRGEKLLGNERWTLDTPEDLEFLQKVVDRLETKGLNWLDVLSVAGVRETPEPGALHLRPATIEDAESLLVWRNDPKSVRFSRSGRLVHPAEHRRWLSDVLVHPKSRILIAEVDGHSIGQIRIDVEAGVGRVSVALAPEAQGRGYGTATIEALPRVLQADFQVTELVAEVHAENVPSVRAFQRAGYSEIGREWPFIQMHWIRPV